MHKILFILVTCLLLGGCTNTKSKDLEHLVSVLQDNHPSLYENITEEEFQTKYKEVKKEIDTRSDVENYYAMKEFVSSIHSAHTMLVYDYSLLPIYGFYTKYFDDELRIMNIESDKEQYLGAKIIAINNLPIDEIYERFETIVSYDTEAWKRENISDEMLFVDAYKYLGIADNHLIVTVELNNETTDLTFKPIEAKDINENLDSLINIQPQQDCLTFKNDDFYSVNIIDDILYIQYNKCQEKPNESIYEFALDIERKMYLNNFSKVVFDLRYNTGGNSSVIRPVLELLQKEKEENDFQLYTLIGSKTYSSGLWNAVDTISEEYGLHATLVGTPTGGNLKSAGDIKVYKMKTLPCSLYYPYKYFDMLPGKTGSLLPDVNIPITFEDYINGKDPVFEYIQQQ